MFDSQFLVDIKNNRDYAVEFLRIYLGITLLVIGLHYIFNKEQAYALLAVSEFNFFPVLIVHYILLAHVCGGLLLCIGLLTRMAALIQLPILVGAVFFVHKSSGLFSSGQSLELSLLVLVLLLVFCVYGGGRCSCDFWLDQRRKQMR